MHVYTKLQRKSYRLTLSSFGQLPSWKSCHLLPTTNEFSAEICNIIIYDHENPYTHHLILESVIVQGIFFTRYVKFTCKYVMKDTCEKYQSISGMEVSIFFICYQGKETSTRILIVVVRCKFLFNTCTYHLMISYESLKTCEV